MRMYNKIIIKIKLKVNVYALMNFNKNNNYHNLEFKWHSILC